MRFRLIAFSLYIMSSIGHCGILETQLMLKIAVSKSSAEIVRYTKQFDDIKVAKLACSAQRSEETVPFSCYSAIRLEDQFGIPRDQASRRTLLEELDRRCHEATTKLNIRALEVELVSPTCRSAVVKARKIIAYRSAE